MEYQQPHQMAPQSQVEQPQTAKLTLAQRKELLMQQQQQKVSDQQQQLQQQLHQQIFQQVPRQEPQHQTYVTFHFIEH